LELPTCSADLPGEHDVVTLIGKIFYLTLIVASLWLCTRVPKWPKEVVAVDEFGRERLGRQLHLMVSFASFAILLTTHLLLAQFATDDYRNLIQRRHDDAANAGWWCFITIGGFLIKPTQSIASYSFKPSQTRPVRILCGAVSGIGLGLLVVSYLPFL
jgi:hypothetical protein